MALRLRRGTDAERQLITPLEGELIYTTDTKILYIGDGVTQGGLQVTGAFPELLNDLSDVDTQTTPPTEGQVLKWNGSTWIPQDQFGSGEQLNIDIIADDSTVLVDSFTRNFQGNTFAGNSFIGSFIGDGSQLTNLPIATDGSGVIEGSNYRINIVGDDSSILVNTATRDIIGNFFGDGSGLGNLNISTNSIFDLSDVFANTPPDFDDVLTYDGANFVPRKVRFIYGNDSTVMVNTINNEFIGNFIGDGSGLFNVNLDRNSSHTINIFGDDSSLLLDAVNGIHYGTFDGTHIGTLKGTDNSEITSSSLTNKTLVLNSPISNTAGSKLVLRGFGGTVDLPTEPSNFHRQGIAFEFYDGLAFKETSLINSYYKTSGAGYIAISPSSTSGTFFDTAIELDGENQTILIAGSVVANGSASFDGTLTAGSFKGSLVGDDSTTIVDAVNGTIAASGYIQFGSYTTTDRDLLVALNGMVIYNTTVNRFQGYQNGAWINLDDGTAA